MPRSRLHTSASLSHPPPFSTLTSSSPAAESRCTQEGENPRTSFQSQSDTEAPCEYSLWSERPARHRLTEIQAGVKRQRDLSEDKPHSCGAPRRPADRTIWPSRADSCSLKRHLTDLHGLREVRLCHMTIAAVQMWMDDRKLQPVFAQRTKVKN